MVATPAEIAAMEEFFASRTLPDTIMLDAARTLHDPTKFINNVLTVLKAGTMNEAVARVRWDDLMVLKAQVEKSGV